MISPVLWQSSRFRNLASDDGELLFLYLLTCPHQNSAGCFWLPDGYGCNDLGWDERRYAAARQILKDAELIRFDAVAEVVLIERWFQHNPPMNPSHLKGIEHVLERCPSDELAFYRIEELEAAWTAKETNKTNCKTVGDSRFNSPYLNR